MTGTHGMIGVFTQPFEERTMSDEKLQNETSDALRSSAATTWPTS